MKRPFLHLRLLLPALACLPASYLCAQTALTWQQLKDKFEASNPAMQAAHAGVDEARSAEITAYLRPNPEFGVSVDGTQLTPYNSVYRPFAGTQFSPSISYLHERDQKRELRRDAAKLNTAISEFTAFDQERGLLFNLRGAYVQVLKSKALLDNAKENLDYWDHELDISRTRYQAGDLALVDLNRLELQRTQFESDYESAIVGLRTAKIQLLMLMNDRTALDQFDVTGTFDFSEDLRPLEDYRKLAIDARPDLKAAMQAVEMAKANHQLAVANGSTDPTFSGWWTHNPSFNNPYDNNTVGASVSIPLRIFDRNQGEKARTQIDISRNQRLVDGTQAQVFSDVDSAYWTLVQAVNLLKPYKTKYLALATDVRDRISFSYQNGGASLIDFLDAEKSYRDTRSAYVNLIGSYMTAGAQLNMAAGREVLP